MRLARGLGAEAAYAPYCATPGIEAMILLGDWATADQLTGRLLSLEPPGGTAAFPRLASGLLRLWQGDAAAARADITRALRDCGPAVVPEAASAGGQLGPPGPGGQHEEAARWGEAVRRWDALCFPYPAAHARWRRGQALLATSGPPAEAVGELRAVLAAADQLGARALARQIRMLAARARVAVEPEPAAAPPGPPATPAPGPSPGLTGRERQVLELLALGHTNKHIARARFISEKTVSVHVTHILAKLGVANRGQAGAIARGGQQAAGDGGRVPA
jgi:DNA-binding CsgD family transcriptional regulator